MHKYEPTRKKQAQPCQTEGMNNWAEQEFETLNLGDARLDKRAVMLAEQLAQQPGASIPQACGDWGQTQAAYRFLSNEEVNAQQVLQAHADASLARMSTKPVVLCLQDTTELDFQGKACEGLGPLSYETQRGMYVHPTYAVTPEREPLGLINAWNWAREFKPEGANQRPGFCESLRWVESYTHLVELSQQLPQTKLVCVGDRESDMMELFEQGQASAWSVDLLVRARHNRVLPGEEAGKLFKKVQDSSVLGDVSFKMPAGRGRKARMVRQEIKAQRVQLGKAHEGQEAIWMTCVIASEVGAPKGSSPVVWRLLTNRQAASLEQACELVNYYRARWEIELLFLVLKEGCRVERLQLMHIERLQTALAMYLIIAWRINRLMRLSRELPDLPAELFFEPMEWKAAFVLNRKKPPKQSPTLKTVVRLVAQLGGFLARKGDGEPGLKTIWLGLREIYTFVRGVRYAQETGICV